MSKEREHKMVVKLTPEQYNLARRRIFSEGLTWQMVLNASVNAYISGDITITPEGRYHFAPPKSTIPLVQVPKEADLIEIDVEWGTPARRPQVGADNYRQHPRSSTSWGTRELAHYLRTETGRRIRLQSLRLLLRYLRTPKHGNDGKRWQFTGPDDGLVLAIKEAILDGTYDRLIREGVKKAEVRSQEKKKQAREQQEAEKLTEEERRRLHLKRLRQTEES